MFPPFVEDSRRTWLQDLVGPACVRLFRFPDATESYRVLYHRMRFEVHLVDYPHLVHRIEA